MPKGIYKHTQKQIKQGIENLLKYRFDWAGIKRGSFSEKHKQKLKEAHKRIPIRNWKGGICQSKQYLSWLKNKRNRLLQKIKINGMHTFNEWEELKKQYNWICTNCGKKEPKIKLTIDHIIPISRGGLDNIGNIQPLCRRCNIKKYTKTIQYKNMAKFYNQEEEAPVAGGEEKTEEAPAEEEATE